MITLRKAGDRGHAQHGWLESWHSFSFADYHDPAHMGVGNLRVINDDRVAPGSGFGTHPHRDMEIISYVIEGELEHRDSMGNGSVIRPGDVQRMSAGTGVTHSEYNPSGTHPVHFLQIWIQPAVRGVVPGYEQKRYESEQKKGRLCLIASPDGAEDSVRIHQDARVYVTVLDGEDAVQLSLPGAHRAYVHVVRGALTVNGQAMREGDGMKVSEESVLSLGEASNAEVLLFDLA